MANTRSNVLSIMTSSLEGESSPEFRAGIYASGLTIVSMLDASEQASVAAFARDGIYKCLLEKLEGSPDVSGELYRVVDAWTDYIVEAVSTPNIILDSEGLVALATEIVSFSQARFVMRDRDDQSERLDAVARRYLRPEFRGVHTFAFLTWLRKDVPTASNKTRVYV